MALLLLLAAASAWAQVEVADAWARATPPGAKVAAGYLTIHNRSPVPDRFVGATCALAARVETHVTTSEGGVTRMRGVKGYDVPAGGSFELKPGGAHLMFVDIKRAFKEGEKIPATLRFEHAGEVKVEFHVAPLGAASGHGH